ncbi:NUMOD4 motif-containing HNH endonuclease [Corynebacterium striatum]|uniref:NUMOD4 motif-containing HNH endonuclease n=1 Tax=Corynebacterium striatum TaxID=43770 RepID=UPI003B58ED18
MKSTQAEKWRPIPGWEGYYEVSNTGRVKSLPRIITRKDGFEMKIRGREIKGTTTPSGHKRVTLSRVGEEPTGALIHRLVLEAFVGPCPDGFEGCHWDDDPSNNNLSNLRWATHRENMDDRVRNWTVCRNGHEITPENVYVKPNGQRSCNICRLKQKREYNRRIYKPKPPRKPKTHCDLGHPLEAPNLSQYRLKQGILTCLACERARVYTRRHPELKSIFSTIAEQYYRGIR